MLRRARPRYRVVEDAAGFAPGPVRITIFESDSLSSVDPAVVQERADAGERVAAVLDVPLITLDDLNLRADPSQPCLLSIDREGSDLVSCEAKSGAPSSRA